MGAPGAHRGLRRTPLARPSRLVLGTTTSAWDLACSGDAACGSQFGQIPSTADCSSWALGLGLDLNTLGLTSDAGAGAGAEETRMNCARARGSCEV
jgi:hypothetical protein